MNPAGPILENETVTLLCSTPKEAPQELRYSWYKNNILLEDAHAPTLHLPTVTRADTGFYFCEVQNTQGSERSGPVSVVVRCKWPVCGEQRLPELRQRVGARQLGALAQQPKDP